MITSSYKPNAGRFLVSEPFMDDRNFRRSVVFLVEHGDKGSLGFVMNRQLRVKISEVVEGMPYVDAPVFIGGPVDQSTLHYVHRLSHLTDCREIYDGVFWGGDFDELKRMIREGKVSGQDILFFVGYSGWGPQQLDEELNRKSWIIAPKADQFVFREDYEDIWRQILQTMGTKYHVISNYPVDPRLN